MDILNIMSTLAAISKPSGMWESMILGFETVIGNYGLTIILITLFIKIAMLPFDFFNRYISKKNTAKMAIVQPELTKLQQKYANNKDILNQKTMELYKKHNYNVVGSCLGMLVNMAVTMTIFFTLFAGLNNIASYKIYSEYVAVETAYEAVYSQYDENNTEEENALIIAEAEQQALETYNEVHSGFLWISNIWRPDTFTSQTLSYSKFIDETGVSKDEITEEKYNAVMNLISQEYDGFNGYLILIFMAGGLTFLSTKVNVWVGQYRAKKKGTVFNDPMAKNKIISYVLPAVMALFTLFYSSAFALYIVAGAMVTLASSPLITWLVESMYDKHTQKIQNKSNYSR